MSHIQPGRVFSLFPAYAEDIGKVLESNKEVVHDGSKTATENSELSWLKNTSFISASAAKIQSSSQNLESHPESFQLSDKDKVSTVKSDKLHYVSSDEPGTAEDAEKSSDGYKSHHHQKKKKKKKKHKKHKKHKSRHQDEEIGSGASEKGLKTISGLIPAVTGKVFLEDIPSQESPVVFSLDMAPDRNNLVYQSIYKGNIAEHHSARHCLGTRDTYFSKSSKIVKKRDRMEQRYFHLNENKARKKKKHEEVIMMDTDSQVQETVLPKTSRDLALEEFMPLNIPEDSKSGAASTETSSVGKKISEFAAKQTSETNADYVKRMTEAYNKNLAKNPHNIPVWLRFIAFQEETFKDGGDLGIGKSRHEIDRLKRQESLAFQMKQAIFERALRENPACVKLKLEHLSLCGDYLDQTLLAKEWKELQFQHQNNLLVWQKYLEYAENKIGVFTVTKLIKAYKKCLQVLQRIQSRQVLSHPPRPGTTEFMTATFIKLCYRLQQAGHVEKAVGLFQGQLEFNLFTPSDVSGAEPERKMDFFTAFWESDTPRLGEDGALGWSHWVASRGQVAPYKPVRSKQEEEETEANTQEENDTKFGLWQALESSRAARHWLPWRPDLGAGETVDTCEDPEGLVLADDITYALFPLETDLQKMQLLHHFLLFLGVPSSRVDCQFASDMGQVTASTWLENVSQLHEAHKLVDSDSCDAQNFENRSGFILNIFKQTIPVLNGKTDICDKLFMSFIDYLKWTLVMDGDTKQKVKDARTAAKNLLQEDQYRGNMLAWQQYAMLEYHLGNVSSARKVLNTTIAGLASSLDTQMNWRDRSLSVSLYRTNAEVELQLEASPRYVTKGDSMKSTKQSPNCPRANHILVSVCEDAFSIPSDSFVVSSAQLLKCRRHYEARIHDLLTSLESSLEQEDENLDYVCSTLEHWVVCSGLFVYQTSGLEAAADAFHSTASKLQHKYDKAKDTQTVSNKQQSQYGVPPPVRKLLAVAERISEAHIKLLSYHLAYHQSPLRVLRQPLLQSLDTYPDNTGLLTEYIALELRSSFTGQLRQYMSKLCRGNKKPEVWILAILAETSKIHKLQSSSQEVVTGHHIIPEVLVVLPEVGLVHTVRTWFERAVTSCKSCVLLWRLYLHFEIKYGKPDGIKAVFYRAVQQCPWSKVIYQEYLTSNPAALDEILDLMTEKELRVHAPLEEIDILLETSHTPPDSPS